MNVLLFVSLVAFTPPQSSFKAERIALFVTAAADVITTRIAIRNGSYEGNPGIVKLFGTTPSTAQLIGLKLVSIGITEWAARLNTRLGNTDTARYLYWLSVALWGYASGLNLRYAWK